MAAAPQRGDFVRVRTRRWLVEGERSAGAGLTALRLVKRQAYLVVSRQLFRKEFMIR